MRFWLALLAAVAILPALHAADDDRDFSGSWVLDHQTADLAATFYRSFTIEEDAAMHFTAATASGASVQWTYKLNRDESLYKIGTESMNSVAKWEGAALLVNTIVTGPHDYAVADRWTLSRDRATLTIHREVIDRDVHSEGTLVYRREGIPPLNSQAGVPTAQAKLVPRPATAPAAPPAQHLVPSGTHVLLSLSNAISTKSSKEGDRVYLQTAIPIAENGHIVIPKGSYVQGVVTKTKPAGRMSAKGELYLRFESLTLPNGVTRDFRARLTSADPSKGKVDPDEGKITGDGRRNDPAKVGTDVGVGSMGGVIVGSAAGHPIAGLGAGAAAGAVAVLLSKNQDVVLQRGTSVEMVLDRNLVYTADELNPMRR